MSSVNLLRNDIGVDQAEDLVSILKAMPSGTRLTRVTRVTWSTWSTWSAWSAGGGCHAMAKSPLLHAQAPRPSPRPLPPAAGASASGCCPSLWQPHPTPQTAPREPGSREGGAELRGNRRKGGGGARSQQKERRAGDWRKKTFSSSRECGLQCSY
jgi:hypothetical protein